MGKVFITGAGRSGTTFIIHLLTRLGFETGLDPDNLNYRPDWRAGGEIAPLLEVTEHPVEQVRDAFANAPRFLKSPVWSYLLKWFIQNDVCEIDHVIMPMRDLTEAAHSRLSVGLDYLLKEDFVGINGKNIEEHQENVLAMMVGKVVEACFLYEIPLTLIHFPRMVLDIDYCYRKVCDLENVDRNKFEIEWKGLARPEQIRFSRVFV